MPQKAEDSIPEEYEETLKDCTALAVNLLNQAITGKMIKRCWDCKNWAGHCLNGLVNTITRQEACIDFCSTQKRSRH